MTYPSGWSVVPRLVVRRERWPGGYSLEAPVRGVPLVSTGQEVVPDQPVLRLEHSAEQVPQQDVPAGLHGRVIGSTLRGGVVIESRAALVRGTMGAGMQVAGVLMMWRSSGAGYVPRVIPPGAILVVSEPLTLSLLHRALNSGVVGIVAGSIALRDLEGFLRTDVLQLLTNNTIEIAQAHLPPLTLLLTEGIGSISLPAHTESLLSQYEGSICLLSGMTSVASHMVPELLISLPIMETQEGWSPVQPDHTFSIGSLMRVVSGVHAGKVGVIDHFFIYDFQFPSGISAPAVRLSLDDGEFCVVPRVMIKRIC